MEGGANNIINKEKKQIMTKIKNLQMWNNICGDNRISVKSSMLGMRTTATYMPTQSNIKATTLEYSPQMGDKIKQIIESPREMLNQTIGDFHPQTTVNGNYILEKLSSEDGQFTALLLLQFLNFSYKPVSEITIFEGKDAEAINRMF